MTSKKKEVDMKRAFIIFFSFYGVFLKASDLRLEERVAHLERITNPRLHPLKKVDFRVPTGAGYDGYREGDVLSPSTMGSLSAMRLSPFVSMDPQNRGHLRWSLEKEIRQLARAWETSFAEMKKALENPILRKKMVDNGLVSAAFANFFLMQEDENL